MKTWTADRGELHSSRGLLYEGAAASDVPHVASPLGQPFPILSTGPRPPLRKVEHFYELGVLSDETTVAALRCGHVAYGVTAEQTYALCDWCPWEAS